MQLQKLLLLAPYLQSSCQIILLWFWMLLLSSRHSILNQIICLKDHFRCLRVDFDRYYASNIKNLGRQRRRSSAQVHFARVDQPWRTWYRYLSCCHEWNSRKPWHRCFSIMPCPCQSNASASVLLVHREREMRILDITSMSLQLSSDCPDGILGMHSLGATQLVHFHQVWWISAKEALPAAESSVCAVYKCKKQSVNNASYELFTARSLQEQSIPPTSDAQSLHLNWRESIIKVHCVERRQVQ